MVANAPDVAGQMQTDSDSDKYGDACDPDFNNDSIVDTVDFRLWLRNNPLKSPWLSVCGDALYRQANDFNNDCKIDSLDSTIFMQYLYKKPGPSCTDLPETLQGEKCTN